MAHSIIHASRVEKHRRLFELIRQDRLAKSAATRPDAPLARIEADTLRDAASSSLRPAE